MAFRQRGTDCGPVIAHFGLLAGPHIRVTFWSEAAKCGRPGSQEAPLVHDGLLSARSDVPALVYRPNLVRDRIRRVLDVLAALFLLTITSPIVLLACLAILIEDGAPVLF